MERAEKNDQSHAVAPDPNLSEHDVEINNFCQYLKAQMKVPDDDWMDFTVDAMMLIKRYCSKEKVAEVTPIEENSPPKPTEELAPEVVQASQAITTMNVVPAANNQSITSYLGTLNQQTIGQPICGDLMSPRMALLGLTLVKHLLRQDGPHTSGDKNWSMATYTGKDYEKTMSFSLWLNLFYCLIICPKPWLYGKYHIVKLSCNCLQLMLFNTVTLYLQVINVCDTYTCFYNQLFIVLWQSCEVYVLYNLLYFHTII